MGGPKLVDTVQLRPSSAHRHSITSSICCGKCGRRVCSSWCPGAPRVKTTKSTEPVLPPRCFSTPPCIRRPDPGEITVYADGARSRKSAVVPLASLARVKRMAQRELQLPSLIRRLMHEQSNEIVNSKQLVPGMELLAVYGDTPTPRRKQRQSIRKSQQPDRRKEAAVLIQAVLRAAIALKPMKEPTPVVEPPEVVVEELPKIKNAMKQRRDSMLESAHRFSVTGLCLGNRLRENSCSSLLLEQDVPAKPWWAGCLESP